MNLNNIRIVLVKPSHPGNIGAVARAMKTMGLNNLCLVQPRRFPDPEAVTFSSHADDILEDAHVVETLDEALEDCTIVFGTSARVREFPKPMFNAREAAESIMSEFSNQQVAVVFGRERWGLENEELAKCQYHIQIPANPDYASLNLAASVQVMCYELRMAMLQQASHAGEMPDALENLATVAEQEGMYHHFEKTLIRIGFLKPDRPRRTMPRLRRLFARALLEKDDIDLLRGIFSDIDRLFP